MGLDMYLSANRTLAKGQPGYKDVLALFADAGEDSKLKRYEEDGKSQIYVSNYDFYSDEERKAYQDLNELFGLTKFVATDSPSATITFGEDELTINVHIGYWRKANQIHAWFVENVQGGVDECEPFEASREQLNELLTLAQAALDAKTEEAALETLPPRAGFFFGSYEIDDWYWQDMQSTVTQIERSLGVPPAWKIIYQSSW